MFIKSCDPTRKPSSIYIQTISIHFKCVYGGGSRHAAKSMLGAQKTIEKSLSNEISKRKFFGSLDPPLQILKARKSFL